MTWGGGKRRADIDPQLLAGRTATQPDHVPPGPRAVAAADAAQYQSKRLGVEPFFMDTSHSPFLSQPAECAEMILEAIERPPIGPLLPS